MSRNSRFEGLTNRSPLLAQILAQMDRQQQFQPQSYGALAAGLGAQFLDQQTLKGELAKEQQAKDKQGSDLAAALSQYKSDMGGGMKLPGTGVQLDTLQDPNARQNLMGSLVQQEHPMAQALAGQLMSQQFAPPPEPTETDVGDKILIRQGGKVIGEIPKGVTPDVREREKGDNDRQRAALAQSKSQFDITNERLERQFAIGEANENARAGNASAKEITKETGALRREFNTLAETENYKKVLPLLNDLKTTQDTPAGDLAFTYGIAQISDAESAVKEGEQVLVLQAGSPLARFFGSTRVNFGKGRLSPEQREQLLAMAHNKVDQYRTAYDTTRNQYSMLAGKMGADPLDVVGEHFGEAFDNQNKKSGATQSVGGAAYDYVPGKGLVKRGGS